MILKSKHLVRLIVVLVASCRSVSGQRHTQVSSEHADTAATVSFCELVSNPKRYNGKEVTVRATYKYGFEWAYLYCLTCLDKGKAWLEIPDDVDESSTKVLKRGPKGAGIANITVRGTFIKCGHCGHENAYPFKFVAHQVSDLVVLLKGMKPDEEQKVERQWACGGTHPK